MGLSRLLAGFGRRGGECPAVFARRAGAEHVARYMTTPGHHGGIGPPLPHNMVAEIRLACYVRRVLTAKLQMGQRCRRLRWQRPAAGEDATAPPRPRRLCARQVKADFSLVDRASYMKPAHEAGEKPDLSVSERAIRQSMSTPRHAGGKMGRQGAPRSNCRLARDPGRLIEGPAQALAPVREASATGGRRNPTKPKWRPVYGNKDRRQSMPRLTCLWEQPLPGAPNLLLLASKDAPWSGALPSTWDAPSRGNRACATRSSARAAASVVSRLANSRELIACARARQLGIVGASSGCGGPCRDIALTHAAGCPRPARAGSRAARSD